MDGAYSQAAGLGLSVAKQGVPSLDWAAYSFSGQLMRQALQDTGFSGSGLLTSAVMGALSKSSYYFGKGAGVQANADANAIIADLDARVACGESINPIPDFGKPPNADEDQ